MQWWNMLFAFAFALENSINIFDGCGDCFNFSAASNELKNSNGWGENETEKCKFGDFKWSCSLFSWLALLLHFWRRKKLKIPMKTYSNVDLIRFVSNFSGGKEWANALRFCVWARTHTHAPNIKIHLHACICMNTHVTAKY